MLTCNLFHNDVLNEEINKLGYVKVQFFNSDELKDLQNFYNQVHKTSPGGFFDGIHMTTWCDDLKHKHEVKTSLRELFSDACDRIFTAYRSINHVFILKDPGPQTEFNVHQDWSIVDEHEYPSLNVWAPLYDTDERNGSLWILPGSHKIEERIRGAGCIFPDYREKIKSMKEGLKPIQVQAGEALIFFHATIHGSPPNLSKQRRVVAVNSIVPKEAPLRIHFQANETSPLEVYEPSDEFVYDYENIREQSMTQAPKGKLIAKFPPITVGNSL